MDKDKINRVLELVKLRDDFTEIKNFTSNADAFLSIRKKVKGVTALDRDKQEELPFRLRMVIREYMENMKTMLLSKLQEKLDAIDQELKEL